MYTGARQYQRDGIQGWSRHRNSESIWMNGGECVVIFLALVDSCLEKEFGE